MKTTLLSTLMASALLSTTPAVARNDQPVFEGAQEEIDEILKLLSRWGHAASEQDVEEVVALHHPDVQVMTRDRRIFEGLPDMRTLYADNFSQGPDRKQFLNMKELRVSGDFAFLTGLFVVINEPKKVEDPGYYMIVFRKDEAGDWKVYRDIDTPSPDGSVLIPAE